MLKHAADLSDSHEYFIVWAGDTNARPWGTKADGYSMFPEFELARDGIDATITQDVTPAVTITSSSGALTENEFAGAVLRIGSTSTGGTGRGTIASHAAGTSALTTVMEWSEDPGVVTNSTCYIVKELSGTRKRGYYPNVRVLTPYQPVVDAAATAVLEYPVTTSGGRSLALPLPYTKPTTLTAFEDSGLLLPLSFHEGITGWGVSDVKDSSASPKAHVLSSGTGSLWNYTNAVGAADHLNGGYVILDWDVGTAAPKRSWAPITDSTTLSFTTGTWLGDGDPVALTTADRWTAWVPHYDDSPFAYLPGEGYTYPNHDMMPNSDSTSTIGTAVHNRPRGITGSAYGDTFGAMLVAASRISSAIGMRVNIVNLGVTDAPLSGGNARNGSGFKGQLGWWDDDDHGSWAPNDPLSLYGRLDDLIQKVLPNAMTAEANTKTLRCLGIVFAHGETDALETSARQHYAQMQTRFITALRNLIDDEGYNPYANGAQIPYVQPRIAYYPNAIDGSYAKHADRGGGSETINADTHNLVNGAIEEATSADEFAASVRVDDLPRDTTDYRIYSGVGEAELGARLGEQLGRLIDHGMGYGSLALENSQTRLVDVCNLALSGIGDAGQITSLEDGSEQATLCKRFLPEARDELLQARQWSFAMRRRQLTSIQRPEPGLSQNYAHCYVLPAEALNAFAVVGPVSEPSTADFTYTDVTTASYATNFIAYDGSGIKPEDPATSPPVSSFRGDPYSGGGVSLDTGRLLPLLDGVNLKPQPYSIEQSPYGHRYILTNQRGATLQYVARVVDADLYSPTFASALAANLGSKLASAIIKGDEGEKVSARMLQKAGGYVRAASTSDANQQRPNDEDRPFGFTPDHMEHRGTDRYGNGGGTSAGQSYYPSGFRIQ